MRASEGHLGRFFVIRPFSLQEKSEDTLTNLEKTIDKDEKYREMAKTDKNFDNIRDDPRFKKLIET
ncbi:hypothetical protein ACFLWD_02410 [Chloroflexota bacterium]